MKKIYKYPVKTGVDMPKGAEILSVGIQNDDLYLWVMADPSAETEARNFTYIGTGEIILQLSIKKFIGTVFENNAEYVWHVFEINI